MIRVLISAAYASIRAGLQSLLAGAQNIDVVSAVSGSGELQNLIDEASPDVIVADDDVTDRGSLLRIAVESETALVLLSDDREALKQLIGIAAPGWALLLRESDSSEIVAAVLSAASGLITVDSSMVMQLAGIALGPSSAIYGDLPDPMTTRELEVLQLLAQGLPNKVIANRLNISQHTVKFHVAAILAKLNAGSRTEAVTLGARRGLVTI